MSGTGAGEYYYHDDPRGNVGALTNAAQQVVYHVEYDAYGAGVDGKLLVDPQNPALRLTTDPTGNPYFWQARRLDPE